MLLQCSPFEVPESFNPGSVIAVFGESQRCGGTGVEVVRFGMILMTRCRTPNASVPNLRYPLSSDDVIKMPKKPVYSLLRHEGVLLVCFFG
jgi:hypothetical protein